MSKSGPPLRISAGACLLVLFASSCAQRAYRPKLRRWPTAEANQLAQDPTPPPADVHTTSVVKSRDGGTVEIPEEWELLNELTALDSSTDGNSSDLEESSAEANPTESPDFSEAPIQFRGRVLDADGKGLAPSENPLVVIASRASESDQSYSTTLQDGGELPPLAISRPEAVGAAPTFVLSSPGRVVRFENHDEICHNFFSTSDANAFDLGVLDPASTRSLAFEHPGSVQVYCSLHPGKQMSLMILPSPHYAMVEADGSFSIEGLQPGEYFIEAWGEGLRSRRVQVEIPNSIDRAFELRVEPIRNEGIE